MDPIKKFCPLAILALVLFALTAVTACKQEEEEEETPGSMSGTIVYDIPYYVLKGETVTMTASGIIYPKEVFYKWFVSGVYSDTLTASTITVKFPDSLGVFTVSAHSYAPGFYSSSTSQQVTTIDTTWNTSLSGLSRDDQYIVDERDDQAYYYVTIGDLDWFSQNLAWDGVGTPFQASDAAAPLFGSFYTWNEAVEMEVCPEGWRVPTQEDWESFAEALAGKPLPFIDNWKGLGVLASVDAKMNGERIWPYSPDNAHTNDLRVTVNTAAGGRLPRKTTPRPITVTSGTTWAIFRCPIRTRTICGQASDAFERIHNFSHQRVTDDIFLPKFHDTDSLDVLNQADAPHQA